MPNYEYECTKCQTQWADIQTMANRDAPTGLPCPHCGESAVVRGWNHAPMGGSDTTRKPQKAFTERLEAMRSKLGRYNPRVRQNIDRSLDMRGGQYGAQ